MTALWPAALAAIALAAATAHAAEPPAPEAVPDLERGRLLYGDGCASCHGEGGRGDGRRAHELDPPPRSFHDHAMDAMSPARAFSAITAGVPDTAMASFELLSAEDRWSLAFYVLSLRHDRDAADRGERVLDDHPGAAPADLAALARRTDAELLADLEAAAVPHAARPAALAALRHQPAQAVASGPNHLAAPALAALGLAVAVAVAVARRVRRRLH